MTSIGRISQGAGVASVDAASWQSPVSVWKLGMQGIAKMLGMSNQQLNQSMASGQSLSQILQAGGKTLEDGAQAFLGGVQSGLKEGVSSGALTQQQADRILQGQNNRVQNMLQDPGQSGSSSSSTGASGSGLVIDASV